MREDANESAIKDALGSSSAKGASEDKKKKQREKEERERKAAAKAKGAVANADTQAPGAPGKPKAPRKGTRGAKDTPDAKGKGKGGPKQGDGKAPGRSPFAHDPSLAPKATSKTPGSVSTQLPQPQPLQLCCHQQGHMQLSQRRLELVNHCLPSPVSGGYSDALRVGLLSFLLPCSCIAFRARQSTPWHAIRPLPCRLDCR